MSNLQVPKTPVGVPASLRQWFDAVGKTIQGFLSKGRAGFLTRGELEGAGVIGIGGDGTATTPTGDLTTPSTVSGLTANGALASIFLNWDAPTSANLAYVEILRADTNDYGTAYPIGTAVRGVNMYKDNVGSGATKYYWIRSVTKAGVKGPPNAVSGVKGTTGYDPSYVMQILTSGLWYPGTLYKPYQYVRPSTPSNYQYVCVSGGTSGATEPTWPTTVGHTVTDGTCTWACEALTTRVPFAIGSVDGQPAVSILSAFIQDACITNAKVHDMSVEKLTAGIIDAISMQLGGYLWNGFSDFSNPTNVAGFWFGMSGSIPCFKLSTGAAGGNKGLTFDGTNLTVTGDGKFDDVFGDAARFNLVSTDAISFNDECVPSYYIGEHSITIDDPAYQGYLCLKKEVCKSSVSSVSNLRLWAQSALDPYPYVCDSGTVPSGIVTVTSPSIGVILPYNASDSSNLLRFKSKSIAFRGIIGGLLTQMSQYGGATTDTWIDNFKVRIKFGVFSGTVYTVETDLAGSLQNMIDGTTITRTLTSTYNSRAFSVSFSSTDAGLLIVCDDDNEAIGYSDGHNHVLKIEAEVKYNTIGTNTDLVNISYYSGAQMWKKQYNTSAYSSDAKFV